jgi:hypothetical protein
LRGLGEACSRVQSYVAVVVVVVVVGKMKRLSAVFLSLNF